MFSNVALDVVIGLVFIYLLYSLLASILQEWIATQLGFRSKVLEKAILRMLEDGQTTGRFPYFDRVKGFWQMIFRVNRLKDKKFAARFYSHPRIKYLAEDNWYSKPGYMAADDFSKIMIDLLNGVNANGAPPDILTVQEGIRNGIVKYDFDTGDRSNPAVQALRAQLKKAETPHINTDTQMFLQSLVTEARGDLNKFRALLEKWFNETMERASGWYKRYVQLTLFSIGLLIAVAFNVDTVLIAKKLATDPKLREQMVQNAKKYLDSHEAPKALAPIDTSLSQPAKDSVLLKRRDSLYTEAKNIIATDIEETSNIIGLGYKCGHSRLMHLFFFAYPDASFLNFIGWLITALAISLGAPFWFDLLSKLMRVRGAVQKKLDTKDPDPAPVPAAVAVSVNTNKPGEEAVG
ncbi:MAG: hypothetical protein JO301_00365 [Chitinophagaceae bacterium]|nr:hypothetical protein [Chitinophagaceae bacterium]